MKENELGALSENKEASVLEPSELGEEIEIWEIGVFVYHDYSFIFLLEVLE